jgi:hypothetical protein
MTKVTITLARKSNDKINETSKGTPFWFTTDWSIHLSSHSNSSAKIILEKLTEKSFLELKAAYTLGLIELDKPDIFKLG